MTNHSKFGSFRIKKSRAATQARHFLAQEPGDSFSLFVPIISVVAIAGLMLAFAALLMASPTPEKNTAAPKISTFHKRRAPLNVDYFTFIQGPTTGQSAPGPRATAAPCAASAATGLNF